MTEVVHNRCKYNTAELCYIKLPRGASDEEVSAIEGKLSFLPQLEFYYPTELAVSENTLFALPPIKRIVPTTRTRMTANITGIQQCPGLGLAAKDCERPASFCPHFSLRGALYTSRRRRGENKHSVFRISLRGGGLLLGFLPTSPERRGRQIPLRCSGVNFASFQHEALHTTP